jgi:hypothetical protein
VLGNRPKAAAVSEQVAIKIKRLCNSTFFLVPQQSLITNMAVLSASTVGTALSSCQSVSMLDEGVWAEVKVGNEHLRLFSERNALGVQTSVYDVKTKNWIAPSEPVDDIEQGKERAATYAEAYLRRIANLELPSLVWKSSRSA